jgi:Ca-activated chloride channel homolog
MIAPKAIPRVALQISPVVLALLLMPAAGLAQGYDDVHVAPRTSASDRTQPANPSAPTSSAKPLRKDVDLVLVPVTVTDPMNRPMLDLDAGDFALYEARMKTLPSRLPWCSTAAPA